MRVWTTGALFSNCLMDESVYHVCVIIHCNEVLLPYGICLKHHAEEPLGGPFAFILHTRTILILKPRKGNADDVPFLFLEADSWRSGFQWAASASVSTCVPTPDSWHALRVPRRAICARRHVPVTWLGGSQEEESRFIPRQRCVCFSSFFYAALLRALKSAPGWVFSSLSPLSLLKRCWSYKPDEFITVIPGKFTLRTRREHKAQRGFCFCRVCMELFGGLKASGIFLLHKEIIFL